MTTQEILSYLMYKKTINKLLCNLNLPKDIIDRNEEELSKRLFDIKTFGYSQNKNISNMWIENEKKINKKLTIFDTFTIK